jgi:hypothetical protein
VFEVVVNDKICFWVGNHNIDEGSTTCVIGISIIITLLDYLPKDQKQQQQQQQQQ